MKIYQNLFTGYRTYFVIIGSAWSCKYESKKVKVLKVFEVEGKWEVEMAGFYSYALKDEEHFPVVGKINLKSIIVEAFLKAIKEEN